MILIDTDLKEYDDFKYLVFDILKALSNFMLLLSMVLAKSIAIYRAQYWCGTMQI